jgi:RNA polymerase sigma-70 factor, ECF subfamily
LKLMFVCTHPAIDEAARAPLMLQTVLGIDAARIASAFVVSPAAMGQRLVRAKAKIRDAGIRFVVPDLDQLASRLDDVLNAVYAAYGLGWEDVLSSVNTNYLTEEASWLAELLCELLPEEAEAYGLLALICHCEARRDARRDATTGAYVPLSAQNISQWSDPLIHRAEAALARAAQLSQGDFQAFGRFQLEAAIQSVHNDRKHTGATNADALCLLYEALCLKTPSIGAGVGRALALADVYGPRAGLQALDALTNHAEAYQPFWAAKADLLSRTGAIKKAEHAFDVAIGLSYDDSIRSFLMNRRAGLSHPQ